MRRRVLWLAGGLGVLFVLVQWTANRLFMPPGFGR